MNLVFFFLPLSVAGYLWKHSHTLPRTRQKSSTSLTSSKPIPLTRMCQCFKEAQPTFNGRKIMLPSSLWGEMSSVKAFKRSTSHKPQSIWYFFPPFSMTDSCQWALCYRQLDNCWPVSLVDVSVKCNNLHQRGYVNISQVAGSKPKTYKMSLVPCFFSKLPDDSAKNINRLLQPDVFQVGGINDGDDYKSLFRQTDVTGLSVWNEMWFH